MAKRMIETDLQEEDIRIEGSLRPKKVKRLYWSIKN